MKSLLRLLGVLSVALVLTPARAEAPTDDAVVWAGRQVVRGQVVVPMLGALDTRVESLVLARVIHRDGRLVLEQRACQVRFAEVAGVGTRMSDAALQALPPERIEYVLAGNGGAAALPWTSGWDAEDHDEDTHPGISVDVVAPLCGGQVHVSSETTTEAIGRLTDGGFEAKLKVRVRQVIHGASNACLALMSSDSEQEMVGRVRYRPVPADTTCGELERFP